MAIITDDELLQNIKTSNLIGGDFHDNMILLKIKEVKAFMLSSGVLDDVVNSDIAIGTIAIGVNDLLSPMGTGGVAKLSPYFIQRVLQLR
jgi:hypothetical protein